MINAVTFVAISSLLYPRNVFAQAASQTKCPRAEPAIIHEYKISSQPSYFFRAFPEKPIVSYATSEEVNKIRDLDSGEETTIPGKYDPVPLWNEDFVTVPIDTSDGSEAMTFYKMTDLMRNGTRAKPVLTDDSLSGVYQSVGLQESDEDSDTYRVLTDKNGATMRSYKIRKAAVEPGVTAVGEPLTLCKDRDIKLPMISKDGKELAALDMKSQKTMIFSVDPLTGSCKEVLNLGKRTGKVDFSFDGRYLVFHTSKNEGNISDEYFNSPKAKWGLQIQILDRETNETWSITTDGKRNSYYPVFRKNGHIVFLRTSKDGSTFSFAIADPLKDRVDSSKLEADVCTDCESRSNKFIQVIKDFACTVSEQLQASNERLTYRTVVQRKCTMCHSHGDLKIDFLNVAALKSQKSKLTPTLSLTEAILKRLEGSGGVTKMPIDGNLTPPEEMAIKSALR